MALLIAAEFVARFVYGLGDPPLFMRDPEIEYLAQPSRAYSRFGNRIAFNAYSMRSDKFGERREDRKECRVLVLGDSIINGGVWTDQHDLATEILKRRLQESLHRPVVVGNISAGSWGPPNLLAYIERFGLFDADAVIIVLGSDDDDDVPTFAPLAASMPERKPLCAVHDALMRYGIPMLQHYLYLLGSGAESTAPANPDDIERSLQALRQLIDLIRQRHIEVAVALHMERREITEGQTNPGYEQLRRVAHSRDTPIIEFGPLLHRAIQNGREPFRDNAHPNPVGQQIMAEAMHEWIMHNAVKPE